VRVSVPWAARELSPSGESFQYDSCQQQLKLMARNIVMNTARVCWVAVATALSWACGDTLAVVRLPPDEPVTVHVGDIAAVHVLSERHYAIGSAGSSLVLLKQTQQSDTTIYFYRAVGVGKQALVATPRDPGPDGCISCVTVHYFITVIE
jgi:hypothetical protein